MIKDFSKRATTVALATAGSVAAFGFAGAAQAAQLNANLGFVPMGGSTTYVSSSNLQNATQLTLVGPPNAGVNMVNIVPMTYLGGINDFYSGPLAVAVASSYVTLTPTTISIPGALGTEYPLASGTFQVTFTTASGPATFDATSYRKTSANANALDLYLLGTTTGTGFDPSPSQVLLNLNQVGGPPNATNYSATFSSPPASRVPEPSAILGILAVAGVGAFARRKS